MIYTKDIIKHIRTIEASLIESQNVDIHNCYHTVKMLNVISCKNSLKDCVLSVYCQSIYDRFIYPIYFYLEYANNWLTLDNFSIYIDKSIEECRSIIEEGKNILNSIN